MKLAAIERARHRIPFWWWLTYDALVGIVIVVGIAPSDPAFWLGFAVLGIAVAIDTAEFVVKRPAARVKLTQSQPLPLASAPDPEPVRLGVQP